MNSEDVNISRTDINDMYLIHKDDNVKLYKIFKEISKDIDVICVISESPYNQLSGTVPHEHCVNIFNRVRGNKWKNTYRMFISEADKNIIIRNAKLKELLN